MGVIRENRRNTLDPATAAAADDDDSLILDGISNANTTADLPHHHQHQQGDRGDSRNSSSGEDQMAQDARVAELVAKRQERKMQRKADKCCPRPEPTFRGLGCRGKSSRKRHRLENGNHVLAHTIAACGFDPDLATLCSEEIDIYDFVPRTVSAFAQLLMEKENMMAWNDFISQSEEDQEILLQSVIDDDDEYDVEEGDRCRHHPRGPGNNRDNDARRMNGNQKNPSQQHPAFSPELSFARIDDRIKKILRKTRRIPIGLLERMEEEVSDFFESVDDATESIYQSCLPSGFQRMLLQATSQYLNLVCKSFNRNGMRWSKVMNENESGFSRPAVKLASYLETWSLQQHQHRHFPPRQWRPSL